MADCGIAGRRRLDGCGDAVPESKTRIEKSCDVILRTTDRMEKMIELMMKNGRTDATTKD